MPPPSLGQLSLAIPTWAGAMSASESWVEKRPTTKCTSYRVHGLKDSKSKLVSGCRLRKLQITLCDRICQVTLRSFAMAVHVW